MGSRDLCDADVLLWSDRQAGLLRRLAGGEQLNDQVNWDNVIEEIESVANEQEHAVSAPLMQAMPYRLKAIGWPDARDAENWQADARGFCGQAAGRFTPSRWQRLDLSRIYRRPNAPWPLGELLAEP